MLPTSEAAKRYEIIDACLRNPINKYPSMEVLQTKISIKLKTNIAIETLQKDIAFMKKGEDEGGFSAPIKYSRRQNGYYYSEDGFVFRSNGLNENEIQAIELATDYLKQFTGLNLSNSFKQAIDKLSSAFSIEKNKDNNLAIIPEDTNYLKGMEYFEILLRSIKQKRPVSFNYLKYSSGGFNAYIVHPYALKESGKRWYLVGYSELRNQKQDPSALRYFGLDRIYSPVTLKTRFIPNASTDLMKIFQDSIGIRPINNSKKEEIESIFLKVSETMAPFIESLPLHKSQNILRREQNGEITIQLKVVPTIELISLILSYGKEIEILQPEWLRIKITENLKNALNKYEN
jgi:predicted DNA-binding transcriptional regulator YafY